MKPLSLIEKAFFLKKIRLFNELDLDLLISIADKMHQDIYDKDEKVFDFHQIAHRLYFIVSGVVEIWDKDSSVKELSNEDFFGEESLFNEKPRTYRALCKSKTLFLTLSRTHLLTIISECPSVATALLQSYTQAFPCRHKSL